MNFIYKIVFLSLLIFPVSSFAQETITIYHSGVNNAVASTTKNYNLTCPAGWQLTQLDILVDSVSGGPYTFELFVDGDSLGTSGSVSTADNFTYANRETFPVPNISCDSIIPITLVHTNLFSRAGEWNNSDLSNATVNALNTDGGTSYLAGGFTIQKNLDSSTVYVPVQSELTALECITNSPTSTCSFSYSTTTASTTPDYSPHFDLFLLFVGLSFFALAIHLFRGLALKYL